MARFSRRTIAKCLFLSLTSLIAFFGFLVALGQALPPPLSRDELTARSDLIIEGRVTKVWQYQQWLAYLKEGGLGAEGAMMLKEVPATEEGMLHLIRNFPYKNMPNVQVAIDGIFLAEISVEKRFKGPAEKVIFIPFVRFHFLDERRLVGPWTEPSYHAGERLKMYLRKTGPFFESTYWNAVRPLEMRNHH